MGGVEVDAAPDAGAVDVVGGHGEAANLGEEAGSQAYALPFGHDHKTARAHGAEFEAGRGANVGDGVSSDGAEVVARGDGAGQF